MKLASPLILSNLECMDYLAIKSYLMLKAKVHTDRNIRARPLIPGPFRRISVPLEIKPADATYIDFHSFRQGLLQGLFL